MDTPTFQQLSGIVNQVGMVAEERARVAEERARVAEEKIKRITRGLLELEDHTASRMEECERQIDCLKAQLETALTH